MFIGSLLDKNSQVTPSYFYTRRGFNDPVYPDIIAEKSEKEFYGSDGNLFTDFVGFDGAVLNDGGIDIHIKFDKECYIDNICFKHKIISQIRNITAYAVCDGTLKPVGTFYGECGKNITAYKDVVNMGADGKIKLPENIAPGADTQDIEISIGYNTDYIILRLFADYVHVAIGKMDIFGAVKLEDCVYPMPENINLGDEYLKNITGISVDCEEAKKGAEYFAEGYESFGALSVCENGNVKFAYKEMADEAFEIHVNSEGAVVYSSSKRGFIYAGAKLLQLCSDEGIRYADINDSPYMEVRGMHIALPDKTDLDFFKRIIKYVLVPLGYNTVILQISALMEYKRHPKINEAWTEAVENFRKGLWPAPAHFGFLGATPYTQDEVREICDYIRSFGLEIAAEIQSYGHVQYITMAYPHLAEPEYSDDNGGDSYEADERPTSFYHHCMCPQHEDYYKIFFDIIDEVCEVIKPEKYIHIGHDEIYTYGKCEKCSKIPLPKLLADEITTLHDYIASKGLKTMMWSDMIVNETYSIPEAIDLVPKDIVCLPFTWYFHLDEDTELILRDHGFEYVIGNFYSSHYPRFNKRKLTEGWRGAQVSAWVRCCEDIYCYEGKIFELIYVSNMLWNRNYHENMRKTYTEIVAEYASNVMKLLRNDDSDFASAEKVEFEKCSEAVPYDIRHNIDGAIKVGCGEKEDIELNLKASKLWIVQATDVPGGRKPWQKLQAMGTYTLNYTDGTSESAPIYYGRDICEYRRTYGKPLASPLFRHEGYLATCYSEPLAGKTADGQDYTLLARPLTNPNPEKTIASVTVSHTGITDASIMVFDIFA